jgi:hypothetical protein
MTDTEFAIRLAAGWAGHHWAGCALAVSLLSISVLICRAVRAPDFGLEPEAREATRDDVVADGIRNLGDYLAAQHITANSRPAPADDISRHFDALLDGPAAGERNTRGTR